MHTTDGPASAGEQLSLAPDTPGIVPTDTTPVPDGSLRSDATAPGALPEGAVPTPTASTSPALAATEPSTGQALALARLIADGRKPRSQRFAALAPYRDVLITERRAGASIRLMAQSLAKMGVTISEETLRVWLLRQKLPKRRRSRKKGAAATVPKVSPVVATRPVIPSGLPTVANTAGTYPQRRSPRIARDNY